MYGLLWSWYLKLCPYLRDVLILVNQPNVGDLASVFSRLQVTVCKCVVCSFCTTSYDMYVSCFFLYMYVYNVHMCLHAL